MTPDPMRAAYLGLLDGTPVSYWEIYHTDLDPLLAGRYPAASHDAGLRLLIGPLELRGRGLGTALLREVTARAVAADPYATRVIAEPDVRNAPSIAAFERAGFRRLATWSWPRRPPRSWSGGARRCAAREREEPYMTAAHSAYTGASHSDAVYSGAVSIPMLSA